MLFFHTIGGQIFRTSPAALVLFMARYICDLWDDDGICDLWDDDGWGIGCDGEMSGGTMLYTCREKVEWSVLNNLLAYIFVKKKTFLPTYCI